MASYDGSVIINTEINTVNMGLHGQEDSAFMKKAIQILALACLFSLSVPSLAAAVPSFNTNAYCKEVAEVGGGSYMIEQGCREMEADAKATVGRMNVPSKTMSYCTEVARAAGRNGSYSILQGCIEMETDAKKSLGY